MGRSYFQAVRSKEAIDLLQKYPNAFILLYVIAYRCQRTDGKNHHNLKKGEALLGDYKNYGLTPRTYRTSIKNLENLGFVTIKTTNKGTIVTLLKTNIFNPNVISSDKQSDKQADKQSDKQNDNYQEYKDKRINTKECIKRDRAKGTRSPQNSLFLFHDKEVRERALQEYVEKTDKREIEKEKEEIRRGVGEYAKKHHWEDEIIEDKVLATWEQRILERIAKNENLERKS